MIVTRHKPTEKVPMFINVYSEGYSREIERIMVSLFISVKQQPARFEDAGILVSGMKEERKCSYSIRDILF